MLEDINKDTVEWQLTYTEEEKEPVYLTSKLPNLLMNGTSGIAVATACSFAPHNLSELMDAAAYLLDNEDCNITSLLDYIKGPDFPTGGTIVNSKELNNYFCTGKGKVVIRADYTVEKGRIVFTSIPYKISKDDLTIEIDKLCENGTIQGISTIRDESNKDGVRFVIELEKNANIDAVVAKLYKHTDLETTFSINQVALVNKKPQLLNVKQILELYIKHQKEVLLRKTAYDLDKIQKRIHILDGLLIALGNIDKVIETIKKSESAAAAKSSLIKQFNLTDVQAQAILDIKLSRLAKLEANEIKQEKDNLIKEQTKLKAILENPKDELKKLFNSIKNKFGDKRRTVITQIEDKPQEIIAAPVEPDEKCVVILTESGLVKKIAADKLRPQRRNGKGVKTQDDLTASVIQTSTNSSLLAFTNQGKVYVVNVKNIPEGTNTSKGASLQQIVSMDAAEKPSFLLSFNDFGMYKYIFYVTKNGTIKKTELDEFKNLKKSTKAIKLKENDSVAFVGLLNEEDVILCSKNGYAYKMKTTAFSSTGKTAMGVKGMNLEDDDEIISAVVLTNINNAIGVFLQDGTGKLMSVDSFGERNRGAKGCKIIPKDNTISAVLQVAQDDSLLVCGDRTNICIEVKDLPLLSTVALGVKVIKDSNIVSVTKI